MMRAIEQQKARESFKNEALAAWEEYQATGLHLTGDEVSAWLKALATNAEAAMPECHT